jgi:hypothetical protein
VLTKVLLNDPAPISALLPGTSPEVDGAFAEALHKDAASRPKTVGAWVRKIVPLLQTMPYRGNSWVIHHLQEVKQTPSATPAPPPSHDSLTTERKTPV